MPLANSGDAGAGRDRDRSEPNDHASDDPRIAR
jgi:hypothetical protein